MSERLFTRDFVLVGVASLSHQTSFQLLLATMPLYVLQMGGRETEVGMLMGIVAAAALAVRPASGWAVETLGRKKTMLVGPAAFATASAAYAFAGSIPVLLALRTLHGLGIGTFNTGAPTLVSDQAPISRRGEALGYFGMSQTLSQALGPAIGLFILEAWGFLWLFGISAGMALTSLALCFLLKDHYVPGPSRRLAWNMFVSVKALRPMILVLGMSFATGSILSFVPLYGRSQGVSNPGFFFTIYAVVMLLSRPVCGRFSDRIGRIAVAGPGMVLISAGMGLLAFSGQWWSLGLSAAILGVGVGAAMPALMALMIDVVGPAERGGAMSTFGIGMDVGIGIGSVVQGMVVEAYGFGAAFGLIAALPLAAVAAYWVAKGAHA
ncbi:MAG: MFS transporter [Deltaproteobacteria bacterium]|nr:MFS transporter [Deltaproteobacteria bacterium]